MRESDSKGLGEKWMISSRMRVSQVAHYSPNMAAFSDAIFTVLIPFTWSSSYEYIHTQYAYYKKEMVVC